MTACAPEHLSVQRGCARSLYQHAPVNGVARKARRKSLFAPAASSEQHPDSPWLALLEGRPLPGVICDLLLLCRRLRVLRQQMTVLFRKRDVVLVRKPCKGLVVCGGEDLKAWHTSAQNYQHEAWMLVDAAAPLARSADATLLLTLLPQLDDGVKRFPTSGCSLSPCSIINNFSPFVRFPAAPLARSPSSRHALDFA
eukprot:CAMPEP_0174725660 /NCGR_PEP_ID=MMETSP1094-20130205/46137_1 /TAXON_ID=156173 /ORGANISM="Chrysochromulina brevifilum, Strain UTEX LB 985" /LENGTH=196 /DNA_ID=CAMNT_0015927109 /DNA_START=134 /DNA_END=721 /DNA_ORIENTATION=+